ILGNYAVYAFSALDSSGTVGIFGQVVDLSTGSILVKSTLVTGLLGNVHPTRCVCLAGTALAIFYYDDSNHIKGFTVTFSGSGVVSFSGATTIASNATGQYDIIATSTGGAIIYKQTTTPGITISTISTALAVSSANLAVTTGLSTAV